MNAELSGLAWSAASKVADERDKLRDVMRDIRAVLDEAVDAWDALGEIDVILTRGRG